MSGLLRTLIAIVLTSHLLPAQAQVYQWRDAQGRLHFGDQPPTDVHADIITSAKTEKKERLTIRLHTQQFSLSPAASEQMHRSIHQIFNTYTQNFRLDFNETVAVHLNFFDKKSELDRWISNRTGKNDILPVNGVFIPRTNEVALWRHSHNEQALLETIMHETSHVILNQLAPAAPNWLHEGMAQYFQTLAPDGERLRVVPIPYAMAQIQKWVANQELITLRQYLSIPEKQWRAMAHEMNAVPYTVAWAMVYFLMDKPVGQQTIRRILHDLEKNRDWPGLHTLQARYPGGIPKLEYDFFSWAQGDIRPHYF